MLEIIIRIGYFIIMLYIFIRIVVIIHESLHKFMLIKYNIKYISKPQKIGYIITVAEPIKFDEKYFYIASAPYVFLMPIFTMMYLSEDIYISMFGIIGLIHHLINYPLEYTGVFDNGNERKSIEENVN